MVHASLNKPSGVSVPFALPDRCVSVSSAMERGLTVTEVARRSQVTEHSSKVVFYRGERIDLRPIEPTDEPLLRRWVNDPAIRCWLNSTGPVNQVRELEWIQSLGRDKEHVVLGIVARAEDRLIGTVGLDRIDPIARRATLGISIGERTYHNRGYGTEAVGLALRWGFEELNLRRIELQVLATNIRAIRCYQKAGFVLEGCRRDHFYRGGQYVDEYLFALLRDEWAALKGGAG